MPRRTRIRTISKVYPAVQALSQQEQTMVNSHKHEKAGKAHHDTHATTKYEWHEAKENTMSGQTQNINMTNEARIMTIHRSHNKCNFQYKKGKEET